MWNLFGVVVLHGSMIDWWGSICHSYICILLYVKLIWCSGVAWIYDWLMGGPSAMHIFTFCCMWNWFGVVVLHGSMINWWGVGSFCHGYMCILLYIWNLFGVMVFQKSMVNWRREGWSLSTLVSVHSFYMWNLVDVVVFPLIYGQLEEGWGQSAMKLIQCSGFPEIYGWLEEGVGVCLHWYLYIHLYVECSWCSCLP